MSSGTAKTERRRDFNLMLAQRILYQLHSRGLFKPFGDTVVETEVKIKEAQSLVAAMLDNGATP